MQTISPEDCAVLINAGEVCAFSGAGISTVAGIPDFRGIGGLYSSGKYDPDTIFDINYFNHNPKPFYDFTREFLEAVDSLKPTLTHFFLAELEQKGVLNSVITQNIDPLHQLAGSKNINCLHGNYATTHCLSCSKEYNYSALSKKIRTADIPVCSDCGGLLKPDVVFFGEAVHGMDRAISTVENSKLLLVLGSSLTVHPAAILPGLAGGKVVIINRGRPSLHSRENTYFADTDLDTFFSMVSASI